MTVTVKFSKDLRSDMDINMAWEMFYLYQQGARKAGEEITTERLNNWHTVEVSLQQANDGDLIDFTLLGDIYYTNGGPKLNDNID